MKILAIESSCDETAAAVVEDGVQILSNVVVSQVDIFAAYGGVIPEVAARSHLEAILPVIEKAMNDAGLTKDDIDAIAVTHTPGLLGSLLIGTLTARVLAILWGKPLYAVHHLKSHIYANWLNTDEAGDQAQFFSEPAASSPIFATLRFSGVASEERTSSLFSRAPTRFVTGEPRFDRSPLVAESSEEEPSLFPVSSLIATSGDSQKAQCLSTQLPEFPLLALVVSGGHTQIIYMRGHNQFEIIGTTRDDAVGECFDKVAKILGLPYPGGPSIDKISAISSLSSPVRSHRTLSTVPLRASNSPRTSKKFESIEKRKWYDEHPNYKLPHPKVEGLDFSFSGLKTAVLRAVQAESGLPITTPSYELKNHLTEQQKADFAASFQETACDILVEKLEMALRDHPEAKSLVVAGGVSASATLRKKVIERFSEAFGGKLKVHFPEPKFSGDNAAMVGAAAYFEVISGVKPTDSYTLSIAPRTAISAK